MGTPAIISFEHDNETYCTVFLTSDGYPAWTGVKLAEWLEPFIVGNGSPLDARLGQYANGMGCLAAQYVSSFKSRVGGLWLVSPDNKWSADHGYIVSLGEEIEPGDFKAHRRPRVTWYDPDRPDQQHTSDPVHFARWAEGRH